jgi:hypothetical protein
MLFYVRGGGGTSVLQRRYYPSPFPDFQPNAGPDRTGRSAAGSSSRCHWKPYLQRAGQLRQPSGSGLSLAGLPATGQSGTTGNGPLTNSAGEATLRLFPRTRTTNPLYTLTLTPPTGGASATTNAAGISLPATGGSVTITLASAVTLSGVARDGEGDPLPNGFVRLIPNSGGSLLTATISSGGLYTFSAAPGQYRIQVDNLVLHPLGRRHLSPSASVLPFPFP